MKEAAKGTITTKAGGCLEGLRNIREASMTEALEQSD
jgi:hypothetical protein